MWWNALSEKSAANLAPVTPEKVMYEFDGPLVFTAKLGLSMYLFSKYDEEEELDYFIAVPTSKNVIDALDAGNLSLRGALGEGDCFLVEIAEDFKISRYWEVTLGQFPEKTLPKKGVGLNRHSSFVVDSLDQLDAFFSVRFSGEAIARETMSFQTFKKLIDRFYDAARDMLAPSGLSKAKSQVFDFEMRQPRFGSLIISIEQPNVNLEKIRRHLDRPALMRTEIEQGFEQKRDEFFGNLDGLVVASKNGLLNNNDALKYQSFMAELVDLLPDDSSVFSAVEFNSKFNGRTQYVKISMEAGKNIKSAYESSRVVRKTLVGEIDIVNGRSKTFVIKPHGVRQVTCRIAKVLFEEINADQRFRQGSVVQVSGDFQQRTNRDELIVTSIPEFL